MLSLRLLYRDWRGGELRLLALALIIAVAAVTGVSWLADRVAGATEARAADLLAADRAVEYPSPIPDAWQADAESLGLATARTAVFPTVVLSGDESRLVSAKAVTEGYPLRGSLRTRPEPGAAEVEPPGIPEPGTAWIESRLLGLLDLEMGETLRVGERVLEITAILSFEPDRGQGFGGLAPRVMFNQSDLAATELLGEGSRVRHKLLLAGEAATVKGFTDRLAAEQGNAVEIERPSEQGRGASEIIGQAKRFLGLAALLTVIVAGVAVLLTVRHYAERQITGVAVMRAIGATRRQVLGLMVGKLLWLGLFAGAIGAGLGYLLHLGMLALVAELIDTRLPPAGWQPLATGWLTAAAALIGFALPTLARLRDAPPMRVLRQDLGSGLLRAGMPLFVAALAIFGLMAWQAGDLRVTLSVFGAVAATLVLLAAVAAAVVYGARAWARRGGNSRLLWLTGFTRRPVTATIQIVAVGLGLMSLFLLAVVRNDLLNAWESEIPPDAPNQFLINIQPDELDGVRSTLAGADIDTRFYPMVRARLTSLNEDSVEAEDYDSAEARRLARREFNLSWTRDLQSDNRIIAGDWWGATEDPPPQLSVETDFAEQIGVELGDQLTFTSGGRQVTAEVTSLREVRWESFNVNFFVLASPGTFDDLPQTWLTSFYLPSEDSAVLNDLVREYPSVTPIDVSSVLRIVRTIIDQGASVVELMALLTLAAGVLVLLAALQITGEQRRFESALLRALGASGKRIRRMARLEFWLVGLVAGGIAGLAATAAGVVVAEVLFNLDYPFRPLTLVAGALVGLVTVWVAGSLGARRYYRVSPMRLLREG
ncbi:ABC transporter permease [Spiribacter vilamensis]|uniref:Putative ABC transport system permease protein n=1 Tax=Spiribacter vilamensis TaxID=531306 RepID=A0A4Q8D2H8_9GAMM|nr:FtsX-like permease family protein [Spiribacter vilamensis]RZU99563.1 putative ABC transport system permease protein [Spiribacter vilamensis]TVO61470.1 FtsX-like permease family protein [Spiribacter vilamensis]